MDLNVVLAFACYRCEEALSITTQCRGLQDEERLVSVTVACPHCGQVNYLSFDASGQVRFEAPVRAITRGQIAVLYEGERVLGGGRIVAVD